MKGVTERRDLKCVTQGRDEAAVLVTPLRHALVSRCSRYAVGNSHG